MRVSRLVGLACVTGSLLAAGCGGSPASSGVASSEGGSRTEPVAEATQASDVPDTTAPPVSRPADPATATSVPPTSRRDLADLEGIDTIVVTTPTAGNGERPLLSWDPVDDAAQYLVMLTRSDGEAYWAWLGAEAQIWLGGSAERPPADASGPYLAEQMLLRVFAVDADGTIFAASQPVDIAP